MFGFNMRTILVVAIVMLVYTAALAAQDFKITTLTETPTVDKKHDAKPTAPATANTNCENGTCSNGSCSTVSRSAKSSDTCSDGSCSSASRQNRSRRGLFRFRR